MKLYPYQEEAVNNAVDMLCERGNSLIVAGTGAAPPATGDEFASLDDVIDDDMPF